VSRDAEAALAELLARQAAMRAERRVAEAALEAAQAQLARTEQERGRLAELGKRRLSVSSEHVLYFNLNGAAAQGHDRAREFVSAKAFTGRRRRHGPASRAR